MYRILFLILIFISLPSAAQPSEEAIKMEIFDNISTEYMECAAYFAILQGAFANSGKPTESDRFKEISDKAMMFSLMSAEIGRSKEMAYKVTTARFKIFIKDMQKIINYNYGNVSLLMDKYSDSCTDRMINPTAFMKYWENRIYEKHGISPLVSDKK